MAIVSGFSKILPGKAEHHNEKQSTIDTKARDALAFALCNGGWNQANQNSDNKYFHSIFLLLLRKSENYTVAFL